MDRRIRLGRKEEGRKIRRRRRRPREIRDLQNKERLVVNTRGYFLTGEGLDSFWWSGREVAEQYIHSTAFHMIGSSTQVFQPFLLRFTNERKHLEKRCT